jgi:hypothetical protein
MTPFADACLGAGKVKSGIHALKAFNFKFGKVELAPATEPRPKSKLKSAATVVQQELKALQAFQKPPVRFKSH